MLNGLDPILIFHFYKAPTEITSSKIPLANDLGLNRLSLPPVPIYLSEKATGIYIDSEDKNIDIETNVDTLRDGADPDTNQKGLGNVVSVRMEANKNSLGITLLSAMSDLIFGKLTSKEYGITYLHGPITIFNGLLHSFSVNTDSNTDKLRITLEIAKAAGEKTTTVEVPAVSGTASLNDGGVLTGGTLPGGGTFSSGGSVPVGNGGLP